MKNSMEAGTKFRTEATNHLVNAHGAYRGAFMTSNFPGHVDSHTIDDALRDALTRYGVVGALCVGAKGRACGTCRRILQQGQPRFEAAWVYRIGYMKFTGWNGFEGLCCDRDPENSGRPFPSSR